MIVNKILSRYATKHLEKPRDLLYLNTFFFSNTYYICFILFCRNETILLLEPCVERSVPTSSSRRHLALENHQHSIKHIQNATIGPSIYCCCICFFAIGQM